MPVFEWQITSYWINIYNRNQLRIAIKHGHVRLESRKNRPWSIILYGFTSPNFYRKSFQIKSDYLVVLGIVMVEQFKTFMPRPFNLKFQISLDLYKKIYFSLRHCYTGTMWWLYFCPAYAFLIFVFEEITKLFVRRNVVNL